MDQLVTDAIYNSTIFQAHADNPWRFLDKLEAPEPENAAYLLKSPWPIISLTLSYIVFVCFVGPLMMRNREPFQLKTLIRFYNLVMVILAYMLLVRIYDSVDSLSAMWDCSKAFSLADSSGTKVYQMANFILLVRVSEYLDTIFFTLRKKQNQVTFLHVFHHAFVPIYAYWILRTAPLRFNVFIILVNSFIHVLMYFYYFLATFQQPRAVQTSGGSKKQTQQSQGIIMYIITKLLMFKKYMTQLQILQFVTLAIYACWASLQSNHCGVAWTYIIANFLLAFGFLSLFLHFYMRVYKAGQDLKRK